jgi:hypothetical protein
LLCGGGVSIKSHEKYIKAGKVLDNLVLKSKVLPGPLTDLFIETPLHKKKNNNKVDI